MSDHARLFASAVPGNGSSNTTGENGNDQHTETVATRQTRDDVRRYTPELSDSGQHRTSPASKDGDDELEDPNDGGPTEIEQESIEQMDNIVDSFRSNKITKLKALSTIISILDLNPSRTEGAKDAAVEYYTKTLDKVQALSSSAVRRGGIIENALESKGRNTNRTESSRLSNHDEINELISQIS